MVFCGFAARGSARAEEGVGRPGAAIPRPLNARSRSTPPPSKTPASAKQTARRRRERHAGAFAPLLTDAGLPIVDGAVAFAWAHLPAYDPHPAQNLGEFYRRAPGFRVLGALGVLCVRSSSRATALPGAVCGRPPPSTGATTPYRIPHNTRQPYTLES
jgi:hypothetical protein